MRISALEMSRSEVKGVVNLDTEAMKGKQLTDEIQAKRKEDKMLRQTTSRIIRRAFHASRQARQADDAGASGALKLTFALPHQAIMSDATVSF